MRPKPKPKTLLCTVGTSLFIPNLAGLAARLDGPDPLPPDDPLSPIAAAYATGDDPAVAHLLLTLPPDTRTCGAEANSVASLIREGHVDPDVNVVLVHSETAHGERIAGVLAAYFRGRGHAEVLVEGVPGLQDADPDLFRTRGLRNLAKVLCKHVRDRTPAACAVNATGGYKAQIAVAVMLGQALGLPVYYMHERFARIVAFPPLPVAFDFEAWMRASPILYELDGRSADLVPRNRIAEDWTDLAGSLVEVISIDGKEYVELSATGQIFHETFRERFRSNRDQLLPPPALAKRPPKIRDHGPTNRLYAELTRFLVDTTAAVPAVIGCETTYCNPDLPDVVRFRTKGETIEGVYSDGSETVKFEVKSTATTGGQRAAVVAALNEWCRYRSG